MLDALASETVALWAGEAHHWIERADAAPGAALVLAMGAVGVVLAFLLRGRSSTDMPAA